jgi:ABC-2 type transporter
VSAMACSPPALRDGTPAGPVPAGVIPARVIPAAPARAAADQGRISQLRWALSDVRVLTWRTLARIATTPEQLLNVTVQPLVFALLFSYVFGGAITIPGHGSYRDYLIAGVVAVNMGGTAQGAAIGLAVDLSTGLVDRFRSLPMSRAAFIAGRTVADLILTLIAATVTVLCGLAVGWRIHAGPAGDSRTAWPNAATQWPWSCRARPGAASAAGARQPGRSASPTAARCAGRGTKACGWAASRPRRHAS